MFFQFSQELENLVNLHAAYLAYIYVGYIKYRAAENYQENWWLSTESIKDQAKQR